MSALKELVNYCDELLAVREYRDYCPNGLQVEGRGEVRRIVAGVSACQALLDEALARDADAVLVHHGWFWKGEGECITGVKRRRLKSLLDNDISLIAYHLPLDGHAELGNNAQLARRFGWSVDGRFGHGPFGGLSMWSELDEPLSANELAMSLGNELHREPLLIVGGTHPIKRLGWCSGAAQDGIEEAAALGLDAFISGEVSERTVHLARELGIHYLAIGHHASESDGVRALAEHLSQRFDIQSEFVDIPNPV